MNVTRRVERSVKGIPNISPSFSLYPTTILLARTIRYAIQVGERNYELSKQSNILRCNETSVERELRLNTFLRSTRICISRALTPDKNYPAFQAIAKQRLVQIATTYSVRTLNRKRTRPSGENGRKSVVYRASVWLERLETKFAKGRATVNEGIQTLYVHERMGGKEITTMAGVRASFSPGGL